MAPSPHDLALFTMTAGAAVGALLAGDAADEALRRGPHLRLRRAGRTKWMRQLPTWARPVAFHLGSVAFLATMATSGALLIGALP
ncbi:hypothetical protein [Lichenibacterium dinghuense]|uniref:hypothetical protein n=1 Tax=Lichenibacterium dinghuense TaxID=2895977 RepID=UPI001F474875|nr:hypothetical protein [Lichenibacterium sp. 6Y81]